MHGLERKATSAFLTGSWLVVAALLAAPALAQDAWPQVHIGDTFTADAVRRALNGAAGRLRAPRCAEVFSSPRLRDRDGRALQTKLTEMQTDGGDYLARLSFYDASSSKACQRGDVLAYTTVGAGHVFICGSRFLAEWKRGPHHVEITVIHEMLHTLGLGENPPSSREITSVVRAHCDVVEQAGKQ
jgi:hypothetical protein